MHRLNELSPCDGPESRNLLARSDVRVKLVVALAAILAVVASTQVWLPMAVLAACLAILCIQRTPWHAIAGRMSGPAVLALMICLLQGLMTGRTAVFETQWAGLRVAISREGLLAGALIGARIVGSVSVILVLCRTTTSDKIFAALHWAHAPKTWVEIGALMCRYTFTLFDQAASVLSAQRLRLGYAGLFRSLRSLGDLAGVVALRSIDQADRTHEAMVARGYTGSLPIAKLPPLSRRDRWIMFAGLFSIAAVVLLAERRLPW
jgi:cobalt/nickel transport system permease protein